MHVVHGFELRNASGSGVIVGLAIHNGHTLNLNLAPAVFRKLLGAPLRLEDVRDVHPDVHRSLCLLLEHPAERVEADMGLTYQVWTLNLSRFYMPFVWTKLTRVCTFVVCRGYCST